MQEKTLEELDSFFNWAEQIEEQEIERWKVMYGLTPEDLKTWLKDALEKAREEGRKEMFNATKIDSKTIITQYKEELLGKFQTLLDNGGFYRMCSNETTFLSEVKNILHGQNITQEL